ncbi:MAG: hypothetical protein KDC84_07115 [Crocinitomicaceae bacterium]|nr:hypothetical protein [Crocinitomicaceae bacterium]
MKKFKNSVRLLLAFSVSLSIIGCGSDGSEGSSEGKKNDVNTVDQDIIDKNQNLMTTFGDKLFSIPSPIQTAMLIKEKGGNYDQSILNQANKLSNYSTTYQKALNLGVYGADLGYTSIYDQQQDALDYINVVNSLSKDLGISGAFDQELLERFSENTSNEDSLVKIITQAYRKGDQFLKENDQKDISVLILTGGWVEALYFATDVASKTKNKDIYKRIAEQKNTLKSLIEILKEYKSSEAFDELISGLEALKVLFDKVQSTYEYIEPITDESKRLTTFKNKSTADIDDNTLAEITSKVGEIRNAIVK